MTKILNKQKPLSELIIQKELVTEWVQKNVKKAANNYKLSYRLIYKKFVEDTNTKNIITNRSFALVFNNVLEEQNIPYKSGYNTCYYGIQIEGVSGKSSLIDTINRDNYEHFEFNIINENNLKLWIDKCLIIISNDENNPISNTFISTNKLFSSFCQYFNLKIQNTKTNRIVFGREFSRLLKKYPLEYKLRHSKSRKNGQAGYLGISNLKNETKSPNLTLYTKNNDSNNTIPLSKTYKYTILIGLVIVNLSLLGWVLFNI